MLTNLQGPPAQQKQHTCRSVGQGAHYKPPEAFRDELLTLSQQTWQSRIWVGEVLVSFMISSEEEGFTSRGMGSSTLPSRFYEGANSTSD